MQRLERVPAADGFATASAIAVGQRDKEIPIAPRQANAATTTGGKGSAAGFARPGNRFWPTLHSAGITSHLLSPFEDRDLVERQCGLTNFVARATARADELEPDELARGTRSLVRKIKRRSVRCVAFLGITAYRTGFGRPAAKIGRQEEPIGDSIVWALPNPSGLNAHYQLPALAELFGEMWEAAK